MFETTETIATSLARPACSVCGIHCNASHGRIQRAIAAVTNGGFAFVITALRADAPAH